MPWLALTLALVYHMLARSALFHSAHHLQYALCCHLSHCFRFHLLASGCLPFSFRLCCISHTFSLTLSALSVIKSCFSCYAPIFYSCFCCCCCVHEMHFTAIFSLFYRVFLFTTILMARFAGISTTTVLKCARIRFATPFVTATHTHTRSCSYVRVFMCSENRLAQKGKLRKCSIAYILALWQGKRVDTKHAKRSCCKECPKWKGLHTQCIGVMQPAN